MHQDLVYSLIEYASCSVKKTFDEATSQLLILRRAILSP